MGEDKKPYVLSDLGQKIIAHAKEKGLHLAEDAAEALALSCWLGVKDWLKESAAISETHIDDIGVTFVDYLDTVVMAQIEKIDFDGSGD